MATNPIEQMATTLGEGAIDMSEAAEEDLSLETVFNRRDIAAIDLATSTAEDETIDAAFNRRDIAAIDLQCEGAEPAGKRARHVFDFPDSSDVQDEFFDCIEEWGQDELEDFGSEAISAAKPSAAALAKKEEERLKRVLEAKEEHGLPKKRRLRNKPSPNPQSTRTMPWWQRPNSRD